MPRVLEDSSEYELWENATDSQVWLKRFGLQGQLVDEVVNGRKRVHLKPAERRINQTMAAEDNLDFFKNGMLMPVKLIETTEDVEELKSYPNHLSESEMKAFLNNKKAVKAFNDRVAQIDNPITLRKFIEVAESEEVDATTRQVRVLEARLDEVDPQYVSEVETVSGSEGRSERTVLKAPQVR